MLRRYGKPSAPLLDARANLLTVETNRALVERTERIYACYRAQPRRTRCKICGDTLPAEPIFEKFSIPYFICGTCQHLNGGFEDTEAFNSFLYTASGAEVGAADYREESRAAYQKRVTEVYLPKASFLFDALSAAGEDPKALRHAELGAGTGFYVSALRQLGAASARGWDVSASQIELGNAMIGEPLLTLHGLGDLEAVAAGLEAEAVSMIFMLEHVARPRELMRLLAENPSVRYLLVAVPTVSPSMILELAFPTVFERHLSGHTHLFSEQSLRWLMQDCGFEPIAEWWFGGDAMDLFRSVAVRLRQEGHAEAGLEEWTRMMRPVIDDWQLALDRRHLSSEVHIVMRRADDPGR